MIPRRVITAAKNFHINFSPLCASRYVSMPYLVPPMSTNTVEELVNVTVVTGMTLFSLMYRSVKTFTS